MEINTITDALSKIEINSKVGKELTTIQNCVLELNQKLEGNFRTENPMKYISSSK